MPFPNKILYLYLVTIFVSFQQNSLLQKKHKNMPSTDVNNKGRGSVEAREILN